jgi:hypothetical protein
MTYAVHIHNATPLDGGLKPEKSLQVRKDEARWTHFTLLDAPHNIKPNSLRWTEDSKIAAKIKKRNLHWFLITAFPISPMRLGSKIKTYLTTIPCAIL